MLDYWKLWIRDPAQIAKVLNNERLKKFFTFDQEGTEIGTVGRYQNWKVRTLSPRLLEITGSIHRYWNGGTNENDFTFVNAIKAIRQFCQLFDLNPSLAEVKNLEFGVNLQLPVDASVVIEQIHCFNYNPDPISPYSRSDNCFFNEYKGADYYLKVYDKGKQYRSRIPGLPNTLRLEIKAMNNGYLRDAAGIVTLADLLNPRCLQDLAWKLAKTLRTGLVFDDDTINPKELTPGERRLHKKLDSKKFWRNLKGNTTSTTRNNIKLFRELVERKGQLKIYSLVHGAVKEKIRLLSAGTELADFYANGYIRKPAIRNT